MMKILATLLALTVVAVPAKAQTVPIVGIWQKIPVAGPGGRLIARTSYIFTNVKLTHETVFTGIPVADPLTLICCVKVKDLKPLKLDEIVEKYRIDEEFVSHTKSIKGAPYMYEAVPIDKKEWNAMMATVSRSDKDPKDITPYYAPVIAAKLGDADEKLGKLESGPTKTKLKILYPKLGDKAIYKFFVNKKEITLSQEIFPAE